MSNERTVRSTAFGRYPSNASQPTESTDERTHRVRILWYDGLAVLFNSSDILLGSPCCLQSHGILPLHWIPDASSQTGPYFDVFIKNKLGVFGVHYGDPSFLLDIPPPSKATAPDGYKFNDGDFRRPLWIDPKFPYLVLLPRFSPFNGPLFSRLNVNEKTVPIVEVTVPGSSFGQFNIRWGLDQKVVDSWLYLESLLRLTLRTMMDLYGSRPGEAVYTFLSPISYCYTERNATSHSNAVKIALRSRDAFLPLMAEITVMFILLDARDTQDWRRRLMNRTKLNWQWIVDLEQSAVGNMHIDWLGGIMDLTLRKTHMDHHLPLHARWLLPHLLGRHRVPLYFFYGNDLPLKEPIPDALINLGFVPTQNELDYLNGLDGEVVFSRWSATGSKWQSLRNGLPPTTTPVHLQAKGQQSEMPSASPPASTPFPAVERDSGQKPGEDIHAFGLHNEKRAQHESFDARKARLAREQHASGGSAPGKKGARVFIWEEDGGFFIRRAAHAIAPMRLTVGTNLLPWDLCTALAPTEIAEPDNFDDDDGDEDYFFFHQPPASTDALPALPDVPGRDILEAETGERAYEVLEHAYGLSHEDLCEDASRLPGWSTQDARSIITSRFGFNREFAQSHREPPGGSDGMRGGAAPHYDEPPAAHAVRATRRLPVALRKLSNEHATAPPSSRKMQDKACGWTLGDETWSVPSESGLPALFQHILDANDLKAIPGNLMDIASSNSDLENEWNIDIKVLRLSDRVLFELFPHGSHSSSPSILLESAATVLQVLRSGWGNNSDVVTIIRNLVNLGVAFFPGWPRPLDYTPLPPPIQPTLGRRHVGYTPTLVDFGVYVERRNSFLRSPRGRVALFYGGIVGRLARLVLTDFEDLACYDPYEDVLKSGVRVEETRDEETVLWHETLTEDEVGIVCGVYAVETGQKSTATEGGQQLKYISWWPTPTAFWSSGLNTGWWKSNCERWFVKRLREMERMSVKLFTYAEWKNKIRFNTLSRKVGTKNEKLAEQYIVAHGLRMTCRRSADRFNETQWETLHILKRFCGL
ncbi:hypothetical protein R3P38DRAFT_2786602 [Favolaschia claudopus]|uniref:Uncharacterized protein n=1 Tax=Favolaschia claudopus TaxID=2862362 RepID=A0AAW0AR88_9AGAR